MSDRTNPPLSYTIGMTGTGLAMILSWERSHSILWAALHSCCGWIYVAWFAIWGRG